MTGIDDELLGLPPEPKNKGGRPTKEQVAAREAKRQAELAPMITAATGGHAFADIGGAATFRRPVTKAFLAQVFDLDPHTVTKRLIDCKPVANANTNRPLYDFVEACGYLIKPRMTPKQFVETLNKADLPPEINLAFWNAQRAKVKYKIEAQEAWETEDVLAVFGDAFMTIKDVLTMLPEELRARAKLTDEQTTLVQTTLDELRTTLREKLIAKPTERATGSMYDKPLFGTSKDAGELDIDYALDDEPEGEGV